MQDRYLYRAKHIHVLPCNEHLDGTWVIGYLSGEHYISNEDGDHLIDPETICQCTGLKDKNGKLIWENDIVNVSTNKGNTLCEVRYAGNVAHFQLWQFKTLPKTSTVLNLGNYEEEVCGNIFDNPELLESKGCD